MAFGLVSSRSPRQRCSRSLRPQVFPLPSPALKTVPELSPVSFPAIRVVVFLFIPPGLAQASLPFAGLPLFSAGSVLLLRLPGCAAR